jgi:hypothetical protein
MKKRPKKRSGTKLVGLAALFLAAFLPLAATPKKKPARDTYAVVSGSVFQENGYALPDAAVTVAPEAQPGKAGTMEATSNARGEFVVRVPPGPLRYVVAVDAKGYQTLRKTVNIEGQERVEVTFQLQRESR